MRSCHKFHLSVTDSGNTYRMMSVLDLSRFSYQRHKKDRLLKSGKENRCSPQAACATTPNRASPGSDSTVVNSIPETPPDSFRPAQASCLSSERIGVPKMKRRNKCRLHSSSEDEEGSGNLFSGLKVSKRRKRDPDENIIQPSENCSEVVEVSSEEELERKRRKFPGRKLDGRMRAQKVLDPNCSEIVEVSSDEELERKRRKFPGRKSDGRTQSRARKTLVPDCKKRDVELERCSTKGDRGSPSGRVGERTTNSWRGRTTGKGIRDSELHQLCEMFPQHGQEYLRGTLQQCAGLSEAIATVLAAVGSDDEQRDSPRRPRRRYRRCKLLDPDDSPPGGSKEGTISAPASRGRCVHSESDSGGEDCSPPSVAAASDSSLRRAASRRRARRPRRLRMDSQESDSEPPPSRHKAAGTICIESTDDDDEEEEELGSPWPVTAAEGDSGDQRSSSGTKGRGTAAGERQSAREKLQKFAFHASGVSASGSQSSTTTTTTTTTPPGREGSGRWAGLQGEAAATVEQEVAGSVASGESSVPASLASSQNDTGAGREVASIDLDDLEGQCDSEQDLSDSDDDGYPPQKRRAILEFFNGCSEEEACGISGCTASKAGCIISCRPFDSWKELVETLKGRFLAGCVQLLAERKILAKLLLECQKISGTIQTLVSQLQDSKELSPQVCFSQPSILNPSLQLKPYQLVGLSWLALLHSQHLNGILADEMGLGKTIQAIAFLAHLHEKGCRGPFLIVVPSSTLDNWARELELWCPTLRVLMYWGSQEERLRIRCGVLERGKGLEYEIILSTYSVCIGTPEDRRFLRKLALQCLVLDEGHMLKNMTSQRYSYLMKIKAQCRILLTGTPLQNNLMELVSLLSFIMPGIFQEYSEHLKKAFSKAKRQDESSAYHRQRVEQAKQIMQPFILRRLKSEVLSQLPAKLQEVESCPLTAYQQQLYSATVESVRRSTDQEQPLRSVAVLMELRKVANHPLLLRHHYCQEQLREMAQEILKEPSHRDADPNLVFEDMEVMSDFELHNLCLANQSLSRYTLAPDVFGQSGKFLFLARKLKELKEEGSRVLLFSQFVMMLDVIEVFLQQEGHAYLRLDGQTPITERQPLIDQYNQSPGILVFLLSTRAGGLGINLTSANVVIIHDIDFNPHNDKQAEDRCHRVGQKRDVHVIRLIGQGTIEEDMLRCAQMKLKLEQDISLADELSASDVASLLKKNIWNIS